MDVMNWLKRRAVINTLTEAAVNMLNLVKNGWKNW